MSSIEHQLFAAEKMPPAPDESNDTSMGRPLIRVEKSASLNPATKPLTVEACIGAVEGKSGRAMMSAGKAGSVPGFMVKHHWTKDMPLFARAMVLPGGTLFIASPPDLIDEEQVFRQIDDAEQAAALEGKKGALLLFVSAADGKELAQYDLDSPPVFDGMAAADGQLYLATVEGNVLCLRGN